MPTIKTKQLGSRISNKKYNDTYKYYTSMYNQKEWKRLRDTKLSESPLCECCLAHDRVVAAVEVHHVIPWTRGRNESEKETLLLDYNNLISVCNRCHKLLHINDPGDGTPLNTLSDKVYEDGHGLKFLK